MQQRSLPYAMIAPSIALFVWIALFSAAAASPAASSPAGAVRTPKCTIEIGDAGQANCALVKANDEWILWSNTASGNRSVHFKADDNPFTETSCWDVMPGARARSGPIALKAALKTYTAYASDAPCASNPPSNEGRGAITVVVQ